MNEKNNNEIPVLHISHTDIRTDSRILKEMAVIAEIDNVRVYGAGISNNINCDVSSDASSLCIESLELMSKRIQFVPRVVRHILTFSEFLIRVTFYSFKVKPRVLHVHDIIMLPIGVLLKIIHGTKLIYDAHELESSTNGKSRFISKIIFYAESLLWRWIDYLITVSGSIDEWYKENLGDKKSEVILNSPYLSINSNKTCDGTYLRDKFNIPLTNKVYIYVGGLMRGRGINLLLDVFTNLKNDFHLVLMGYGELEDFVAQHSNEYENIHFHNAVGHAEVVSITSSADVGLCLIENVSLSDYYCLPNKLFEYAFANIPVIASDFPEISKMVKKYKLGVCVDVEPNSIKNAILSFSPGAYSIHSNTVDMLTDVNWNSQSVKLKNIYNEISE